jgi:hypothetical protein
MTYRHVSTKFDPRSVSIAWSRRRRGPPYPHNAWRILGRHHQTIRMTKSSRAGQVWLCETRDSHFATSACSQLDISPATQTGCAGPLALALHQDCHDNRFPILGPLASAAQYPQPSTVPNFSASPFIHQSFLLIPFSRLTHQPTLLCDTNSSSPRLARRRWGSLCSHPHNPLSRTTPTDNFPESPPLDGQCDEADDATMYTAVCLSYGGCGSLGQKVEHRV